MNENERRVIILVALVLFISDVQYSNAWGNPVSSSDVNIISIECLPAQNALIVSSSSTIKILFDERALPYHDEYEEYSYSIESVKKRGYSHLAGNLRKQGCRLYRLDEGEITLEELLEYDILILTRAPVYTPEEIDAITTFVKAGGSLLQLGNIYQWEKLESVSSRFGVHFPQEEVELVDPVHRSEEYATAIEILQFFSHPITEGIQHVYFNCTTYIESHSQGTVLAKSSSSSFADKAPYNDEKDAGEKQGPFIVLLAVQEGKGRAVFTGDETFIRNDWISYLDNEKLALNIFEWLSKGAIELDGDGDGYSPPEDCNDNDSRVHPGAKEICDGKDNDCDGQTDEGYDKDDDRYTTCDGDCNDSDSRVHPGAYEPCGEDYNCDGRTTLCTGNLEIFVTSKGKQLRTKVYVNGSYKGVTDSQGRLTISGLEADEEYSIRVEKEGYHLEEKTVTVVKETTTRVEIEMEKEFEIGTVLLIGLPVCGLILVFFIFKFRKSKKKEALELLTEIPPKEVEEKAEKKEAEERAMKKEVQEKEKPKVVPMPPTEKSKKIICPFCKNEIEEHWVSCPLCGTKLKDDTRVY